MKDSERLVKIKENVSLVAKNNEPLYKGLWNKDVQWLLEQSEQLQHIVQLMEEVKRDNCYVTEETILDEIRAYLKSRVIS